VLALLTFWLRGDAGEFVRSVISNTITAPFVALAWTVMYYRLIGLKEPGAAAAAVEPIAEPPVPPASPPPPD
jgi:hypothetical protein